MLYLLVWYSPKIQLNNAYELHTDILWPIRRSPEMFPEQRPAFPEKRRRSPNLTPLELPPSRNSAQGVTSSKVEPSQESGQSPSVVPLQPPAAAPPPQPPSAAQHSPEAVPISDFQGAEPTIEAEGAAAVSSEPQGAAEVNSEPQGAAAVNSEAQGAAEVNSEAQGAAAFNSEAQGAAEVNSEPQGAAAFNSEAQGAAEVNSEPQGAAAVNIEAHRGEQSVEIVNPVLHDHYVLRISNDETATANEVNRKGCALSNVRKCACAIS